MRGTTTDTLREEVLEEWQAQLQKIEMGECFEGMELFAPYYTQPLASLADYLGQLRATDVASPLLVLDDPDLIRLEAVEVEREAAELYKSFVDNGELPPGLLRPYLTWEEVSAHGRDLPTLSLGGGAEGAIETPDFAAPHLYAGNLAAAIDDIKGMVQDKSRIVIVSQQSARLRELLEDEDVYPTLRKATAGDGRGQKPPDAQSGIVGVEQVALSTGGKGIIESLLSTPPPGTVNLLQGALPAGWQLRQFAASDVVVLTDAELFGRSQVARRQPPGQAPRRSNADAAAILREKMLLELQPGDYVVHVEHGIAKYGGLVRMEREGTEREYMLLLYAENDRLYVPADQTDRVAPYIGAGPPPHLHRLGTPSGRAPRRRCARVPSCSPGNCWPSTPRASLRPATLTRPTPPGRRSSKRASPTWRPRTSCAPSTRSRRTWRSRDRWTA